MAKTHCRSDPTGHAPPLVVVMKTLVWGEPPPYSTFGEVSRLKLGFIRAFSRCTKAIFVER
jgi:hypothetical protein